MKKFYEVIGKTVVAMGASFLLMRLAGLAFIGIEKLFNMLLANGFELVQMFSIGVFACAFISAVIILHKEDKRAKNARVRRLDKVTRRT